MIFCYFKQKTSYEWLIRDWSSDVCSSDLSTSDSATALDRAWATFLFAYGCRTRYLKDRMRRWLARWESLSDYAGPFGTAKAHDEAQTVGLQRLLRETGQYKGRIDGDRGPMTRAAEAAYLNSYADNVRQIIRTGK